MAQGLGWMTWTFLSSWVWPRVWDAVSSVLVRMSCILSDYLCCDTVVIIMCCFGELKNASEREVKHLELVMF